MTRYLNKLLLAAGLFVLLSTSAYADVSQAGYYITTAFVLFTLLLPAFVVALTHRARKKFYLTLLILFSVVAFTYLLITRGRQTEFFVITSVPYIILVIYFFKEKTYRSSQR